MPTSALKKSSLSIRPALSKDIAAIRKLNLNIYGKDALDTAMIRGQISNFPEGQFVAEHDGKIVGYCANLIINEKLAMRQHSWAEATGNGFATVHDDNGNYLYGIEICVDENYRNLRIGQRLYDAREELCQEMGLLGVVIGSRMPGFAKKKKKIKTPEEYIKLLQAKKIRDPAVGFQLRNGFEIIGVLKDYLPDDPESDNNAVHMIWRNPMVTEVIPKRTAQRGRIEGSVRVASVQFQVRPVKDFDQFAKQIEYFVDVASDYRADFVLFPELITLALLTSDAEKAEAKGTPADAIMRVTQYTDQYVKFLGELALSYNINIIGGSHPTLTDNGDIENIAYIFLRDGSVHAQPKLHPTPTEKFWWNVKGGDKLRAIETDCGPIGVLICYDSEFPEAARYLADQGAMILFVPFCCDEKQGYQRVRYCCQARAVENQFYVAMAGVVGNLPDVEDMDIHYAESAILTPCDFPFARDGIAATSAPNTEMIVFADLRLEDLVVSRNSGTVQNLKDRRFDLYRVDWKKQKHKTS